ncbi:Gfo/Idh/MocA family protein [Aeromicrobium wangtongii]|uniref:Gfo/Idh/MocA family oxidoreductase n=1 Tax=Aeromicrobium wangtongii TaxID=2969247 RepID=A0ABY5M663_9ACTN|nr:Gfo/Idh/MocA family oxidoreductase [Aeromicrobium wangtongii]MCD9198400.1 Gfo/Idh/MocA family oxidoreductase [Aeromicrobium wangtongii]UUP12430.1 Gfo/Idh/MocA family oxidoreductase [Aeromicrobium wangtongii]
MTLRIGVLGAARIAESALIAPARLAGHRVVAVGARDAGRARAFATRHGVERAYGSYDEVLADPEVDVVYNALVNSQHAPWNLRAVAAGKHVLSEKPFAANGAQARSVADAACGSDRIVMEAFHYAMHPMLRRIRAIVLSGELGDLRHVEATVMIPAPADDDPRWRLDLAGGAMMDLGCYGLHAFGQVAGWLGGSPLVRSARAGQRVGRAGVDEWVQAELELPAGATASLLAHMAGPELQMRLVLTGSRGQLEAPCFVLPQLDERLLVTVGSAERHEWVTGPTSYDWQLAALDAAVRGTAPPPLGLDDAVATMDLVDATYRAAGMQPRPGDVELDGIGRT